MTRLYYEAHVNLAPVSPAGREALAGAAQPYGFHLAKLLMEKGRLAEDAFLTARSGKYEDIESRLRWLVQALRERGYVVRRYKIEDTLLDSRHGDVLPGLEGATP